MGLEPTTYALQVRCTASCATAAYKGSNLRQSDYYIVELYPLGSASSLCRLSHLKGRWDAPYAVQLTLSAFSLGSSITPNWHFTKVAKSLYKISHLLVYDFDCFHWRINTHNLFSSSTTPRS